MAAQDEVSLGCQTDGYKTHLLHESRCQGKEERVTVQASQKTLHAIMEDKLQSMLVESVFVGVSGSVTKKKKSKHG